MQSIKNSAQAISIIDQAITSLQSVRQYILSEPEENYQESSKLDKDELDLKKHLEEIEWTSPFSWDEKDLKIFDKNIELTEALKKEQKTLLRNIFDWFKTSEVLMKWADWKRNVSYEPTRFFVKDDAFLNLKKLVKNWTIEINQLITLVATRIRPNNFWDVSEEFIPWFEQTTWYKFSSVIWWDEFNKNKEVSIEDKF